MRHWNKTKLTKEQEQIAKCLYMNFDGLFSQREIAYLFKVSQCTISHICSNPTIKESSIPRAREFMYGARAF